LEGVINKLLRKGADPHLKTFYGETILHQVINASIPKADNSEKVARLINCFKLLLNLGQDQLEYQKPLMIQPIDVNAVDLSTGLPVLLKVIRLMEPPAKTLEERSFYAQCLDLLLSTSSIDVNAKSRSTALHLAAQFGVDEAVEKLLKKGADPHFRDKHGRTVLHEVVFGLHITRNQLQCLDLLLTSPSTNINIADNHGKTALHIAAKYGNHINNKVLKYLITR